MSSLPDPTAARAPKRKRGKQRVSELLEAAARVFAEKGYEAATMTEIAVRAGAPIGSLYQFFPAKAVLADTLVQNYVALLEADLQVLLARGGRISVPALVEGLFGVLRGHPGERAAALPLAEARMDERARRLTFRHMLRKNIAAILRARAPRLSVEEAREMAIVVVQLMKAASALSDEEDLPGRAGGLRGLQALTVRYLEQHLGEAP